MKKSFIIATSGALGALALVSQLVMAAPITTTNIDVMQPAAKATKTPKAPKNSSASSASASTASTASTGSAIDSNPAPKTAKETFTVQGRVMAPKAGSFSLETSKYSGANAVQITYDSKTEVLAGDPKGVTNLSKLAEGDRVLVLLASNLVEGQPNTAKSISVLTKDAFANVNIPPKESRLTSFSGKIDQINANGFTIAGRSKKTQRSVTVGKSAQLIMGAQTGTLSSLKAGDRVTVYGTGTAPNYDAAIVIDDASIQSNRITGELAAVNGTKVVVFTRKGQEITVDASKAISLLLRTPTKLSEFDAGWPVSIIALKSGDTYTAQLINETELSNSKTLPKPVATATPKA